MTSTTRQQPATTPVPKPQHQAALAHHLAVGDAVVTTLLDTSMQGSLAILTNIDEAKAQQLHAASRRAEPRITLNAFLVNLDDRLILIDTGIGIYAGESGSYMRQALDSIGVAPEAIDTVLLTHLHADHVGGLIDADDNALFPNATVMAPARELEFWTGDDADSLPESRQKHVQAARRALASYADRIKELNGGEVLPGIEMVALPGHTPGHCGYMITSGNEQLLIWGDIVHLPAIQLPCPQTGIMFDVDAEQAQKTRLELLAQVARDGTRVAGMHLEFPAIGHIANDGEGYLFLPISWQPRV
ncbi:MBL fold metallo-hydrolase [Phytohalomonas tamaricis]|uniref:MBL fold metallo-hydrolase n=1 Tax=Phytohalomonas tamaricis TaxID=2081032 RepID=UPI000D0BC26F|nr:MBL fold metallo-hydrolase [Phytohalomonas tamaricis]